MQLRKIKVCHVCNILYITIPNGDVALNMQRAIITKKAFRVVEQVVTPGELVEPPATSNTNESEKEHSLSVATVERMERQQKKTIPIALFRREDVCGAHLNRLGWLLQVPYPQFEAGFAHPSRRYITLTKRIQKERHRLGAIALSWGIPMGEYQDPPAVAAQYHS